MLEIATLVGLSTYLSSVFLYFLCSYVSFDQFLLQALWIKSRSYVLLPWYCRFCCPSVINLSFLDLFPIHLFCQHYVDKIISFAVMHRRWKPIMSENVTPVFGGPGFLPASFLERKLRWYLDLACKRRNPGPKDSTTYPMHRPYHFQRPSLI